MTVTGIARRCGLSRTAVLYYESEGLLRPASRTASGYRRYGEAELLRLEQIRAFRHAGLSVGDIRVLLDQSGGPAAEVLERRFQALEFEIELLRGHQRAIARLLRRAGDLEQDEMITKEKWIEIMRAAGFDHAAMNRWHTEFERLAPQEHQEFLEYLHIPDAEIGLIRQESAKGAQAK
jgi:DNA-binding transcriptional MerR regulator